MKYPNIYEAVFISRPNRFIANVAFTVDNDGRAGGEPFSVHVKNTGRCRELLIPGTKVYLTKSENKARKTAFDLVAVEKGPRLINMDSQAPNHVFHEYLKTGAFIKNISLIKPEAKYKNSRFDFYVEAKTPQGEMRRIYIEVKGVTLEEKGVVLFPDAPTERGIKHLKELAMSLDEGYEAIAVFVVQMDNVLYFTPNNRTHKAFGDTLKSVRQQGVELTAFTCNVTPESLTISERLEVRL